MKVKDYEIYRGFYCSLCRTIGRRYGFPARLLLSYDVTFYVIVLFALSDRPCSFRSGRCPVNPTKRCAYCRSGETEKEIFNEAADLSVALSYWKLQDTIDDEPILKKIPAILVLPFFALLYRIAQWRDPNICATVKEYFYDQTFLESPEEEAYGTIIDSACDPTGKFIAGLLCRDGRDDPKLNHFGYLLGRYIYLADALDDIEKDIKHHTFNPFVSYYDLTTPPSTTQYRRCEESLQLTVAELNEALDKLPIDQYLPIIENVLCLGLYEQLDFIKERRLKGKK